MVLEKMMEPTCTELDQEYKNDKDFKGSPDHTHFMFEINVGKSRIRHRTTLKMNGDVIQIQSRSMSDSTFSDLDLKNWHDSDLDYS